MGISFGNRMGGGVIVIKKAEEILRISAECGRDISKTAASISLTDTECRELSSKTIFSYNTIRAAFFRSGRISDIYYIYKGHHIRKLEGKWRIGNSLNITNGKSNWQAGQFAGKAFEDIEQAKQYIDTNGEYND